MTNTHITIGGHKVSAGKVYSTSEVRTGDVWVDGKPIYRKVIRSTSLTKSTSGSRAEYSFEPIDTNIDTLIGCSGYAIIWTSATSSYQYLFGSANISTNLDIAMGMRFQRSIDTGTMYFVLGGNSNVIYDCTEIAAIIEYTKTTD